MGLLFSLDGRMELIACLLLYFFHKNGSSEILRKTILSMADSSKYIQKK